MKIRIFIYFLLLLFLPVQLHAQVKRALVIGLGEQQDKAWNKINGEWLDLKRLSKLQDMIEAKNADSPYLDKSQDES